MIKNKNYHKYWIDFIEKWFETNDELTIKDFLDLQQIVEMGFKLNTKLQTMEMIDFVFKKQKEIKENPKEFKERLEFLNITDEEIQQYKRLKARK